MKKAVYMAIFLWFLRRLLRKVLVPNHKKSGNAEIRRYYLVVICAPDKNLPESYHWYSVPSSGWDFVMSQDTVTQRAKFCAKVNSCEYRERLNKYLPGAYFTLATYDMTEDTIDALDKTLGRNVFAFRTELLAIVNDLDAAYRAYACE